MKTRSFFRSLVLLTAPSMMFANPQGLQVMSGEAALSQQSHTLEVTTGNQAILHWDSFSISEQETTRFVMPSSSSTVLNRVLGGDLSQIMGTLEANGKVFLINPKGVLVGKNAQVDTSSFIASSFDVLDSDFLQGKDIAFKGEGGSVVNLGKIHAWDGDIFLVGYQVTNEGALDAEKGVAALAAGTEVLMRPAGDERILIRAHLTEAKQEIGVHNTGTITALQAELKADGNPYKFAVKDAGTINALQKVERNGKIFLVATDGAVEAKGHYNAASGEVQVLGNWVRVDGDATIDVSGVQGGSVLVGGDYQGLNPEIQNSDVTYVGPNVRINADALENGDGGKVILWGNKGTGSFGRISAEAGPQGGNGGFVEVSGREYLAAEGSVSTFSPRGKLGTLLYDPCTVTISNAADSGDSFDGCPAGTYSFSGATSNISIATLVDNLSNCSVTVDASASGTATAGSITISDTFLWDGPGNLTLNANDSPMSFISLEAQVSLLGPGTSIAFTSPSVIFGNASNTVQAGVFFESSSTPNSMFITGDTLTVYGYNASPGNGWYTLNVAGTVDINLTGDFTSISDGATPNEFVAFGSTTNITCADLIFQNSTTLYAGQTTINCSSMSVTDVADIQTETSFLTINSSGPVTFTAGVNYAGKLSIRNQGGMVVTCPEFTCLGGTNFANSPVKITNGTSGVEGFSINCSGLVNLVGGTQNNTGVLLNTPYTLSIQSEGLTLQGGSGTTCSVQIQGAPVFIDGTAAGSGAIQLIGGNGPDATSPAIIETLLGAGRDVNFWIGSAMGTVIPTNITLTANSSPASILTGAGGTLTSTISGNYALTGGSAPASSTSQAGILANGNMSLTGGNITLTGGSGVGNNQALIQTGTSGGALTMTAAGPLLLQGGSGTNSSAQVLTQTGLITLNCSELSLTGGATGSSNGATVQTVSSGNIAINSTGSVNLTGGGAATSSVAINSNANLSIESSGVTLQGGSGTSSSATLVAQKGQVSIDGTAASTGNIQLIGGSDPGSVAAIQTVNGGAIAIGQTAGTMIPTGLSLTANAAPVRVYTSKGGNITSNINGDYVLTGGSIGGTGTSNAKIDTGDTSGSGNLSLTGNNYILTGGTGAGTNQAFIQTGAGGGNLALAAAGTITLQGGTGANASATIVSQKGQVSIDGTATSSGNVQLIGGPAPSSLAAIQTSNGGAIAIGQTAGTMIPTGLSLTANAAPARVYTIKGGNITSSINGNYALIGGTVGGTGTSNAKIDTGDTSGGGNISLTGAGYILNGGTGAGTNGALIQTGATGGTVAVTATGTLELMGGSGATSNAQILTTTGNITINAPLCVVENGTGASSQSIIHSTNSLVLISSAATQSNL